MVKQLHFYADAADELQFAEAVVAHGAVFMPSYWPEWPFPILRPPLPSPTERRMDRVVIWHREIFREEEMWRPDNRPYNPAGRFYLATCWPVLEFNRPHPAGIPVYWASLRCSAGYWSFRFRKRIPQLSPEEVQDFKARTAQLELLYRRLCSWVRRKFVRVGRATFCGPSVRPHLPH
jgi:hypothetical protein